MPQTINKNFIPETVALEGSNLIEASAGTGKTYSIAILTLRLIIEKNIPIEKILIVTFTKAAVAELETRVRSFVRLALKVSRGEQIEDKTIEDMVKAQMDLQQHEKITVEDKLKTAQEFLDETSVLTIHSFCQKTLSEYSFETSQIFGAETISPDEFNQITEDAFNEFWRKRITTINRELLERMLQSELKHEDILKLVKQAFGGKMLVSNEPIPNDFLSQRYQDRLSKEIKEESEEIIKLTEKVKGYFVDYKAKLMPEITRTDTNRNAFEKDFNENNWDAVIKTITEKQTAAYVGRLFKDILQDVIKIDKLHEERKKKFQLIVNNIAVEAIRVVKEAILEIKSNRGIITFDDMIDLLHKAVMVEGGNQKLITALQKKYDAVFIDEFQDTDKAQYVIFEKLFNKEKILFYIGDPKQSIYAFRKADIYTYFNAKDNVDHLHEMNTNHRSTEAYINAMNEFFLPTPEFDTFSFQNDPHIPNAIEYIKVGSPNPNTKGELLCNEKPIKPLKITSHPNKKEIVAAVKNTITDLFTEGKYTIKKDGKEPRPIQPSDIGILVRNNKQAKIMKSLLASLRIPAVTIDETRILSSDEAIEIFYILSAVDEISTSHINRALMTNLGGYDNNTLLTADDESILAQFKIYQETWKEKGVYLMLRKFMADHKVNERLYDPNSENPERVISNIQQLIEILHKIAIRKKFEPKELIQWLKKGMEGDTREGDEYEQRLENDQDAVQIVTIHKSKGLEYNIVIAPHLDLKKDENHIVSCSYRDPKDGEYYVVKKKLMDPAQRKLYEDQSEQENRRLMYVAVTRARYQCFITAHMDKYYNNSCLRTTYKALYENVANLNYVEFGNAPDTIRGFRYTNPNALSQPVYSVADHFHLDNVNWIKTSYSGLNPEHDPVVAPKVTLQNVSDYDKFAFQELKKGAHTGNLLHYIFEHIDFTKPDTWKYVIEQAMKRLSGSSDEQYRDKINELLEHVLSAEMPGGNPFSLNQVAKSKRLNELEFDFLLSPFNTTKLEALSNDAHPFRIKTIPELDGIMNGKIDLFFEHNGKYFILDWKSNFLGNSLEFYGEDSVKAAMYENNYNLQYLIYTVALTKYLKLRKPDFNYERDFGGVIYLFLRGVRADGQTGIYYSKPEEKLIEEIKGLMTLK
jgi:exodeoxyribonuclease V beta subunit